MRQKETGNAGFVEAREIFAKKFEHMLMARGLQQFQDVGVRITRGKIN